MKLVELIIDILEKTENPLKQGEILSLAETHSAYKYCDELHKNLSEIYPNLVRIRLAKLE